MMSIYTKEILEAANRWNGILPAPSKEARKTPNGLPVFNNKFIETWIARANPIVPGLWAIPVSSILFWIGSSHQSISVGVYLWIIGFFSWTLLEYAIHLYLFHKEITPNMNPKVKFLLFMLHGYHHEYPNDGSRLVMPIAVAWPLATIIGLIFWMLMGTNIFFHFYSGLLIGYLAYDWVHYAEHHVNFKSKAGKFMRLFHSIHHFVDENKNFGISTPIWDWVLGKAQNSLKSPINTESVIDKPQ